MEGGGGGEKTFPCTPSPTNRGQEVLEAKSGGSGRQGNQERDRKKEIHGGGGTRKERENGRLQEAPALTTSCWGCHCHRGGQGYLRGRPKTGSKAGAQRLITQGLHGHIKQMTVITELLPLLERETQLLRREERTPDPERSHCSSFRRGRN